MCRYNEDWQSGFVKHSFADATDKKLIHRASPMGSDNNHIDIQIGGLLQNRVYRSIVHEQGRRIYTRLAQSIRKRLNLAMFDVEFLCEGFPRTERIHFKFNNVRGRLLSLIHI